MRMIVKGFRFGMILQLAIGPMCIFIFQTSIKYGFLQAEQGVIGTAIVDSLEILLAILGVGMILEKSKKAEFILKMPFIPPLYFFRQWLPVVSFGLPPAAPANFCCIILLFNFLLQVFKFSGVKEFRYGNTKTVAQHFNCNNSGVFAFAI